MSTGLRDSPPGPARTASRSKRGCTCRERRRCSPRVRSTASTRWQAAGSRNTSKRRSRWSAAAVTSTSRSPSPTCAGEAVRALDALPPGRGRRAPRARRRGADRRRRPGRPRQRRIRRLLPRLRLSRNATTSGSNQLFSPAFIVFPIQQSPKGFAFEYVEGTLCVSLHGSEALGQDLDRLRDATVELVRGSAPRSPRSSAQPPRPAPPRARTGSRQPPRIPRPRAEKSTSQG